MSKVVQISLIVCLLSPPALGGGMGLLSQYSPEPQGTPPGSTGHSPTSQTSVGFLTLGDWQQANGSETFAELGIAFDNQSVYHAHRTQEDPNAENRVMLNTPGKRWTIHRVLGGYEVINILPRSDKKLLVVEKHSTKDRTRVIQLQQVRSFPPKFRKKIILSEGEPIGEVRAGTHHLLYEQFNEKTGEVDVNIKFIEHKKVTTIASGLSLEENHNLALTRHHAAIRIDGTVSVYFLKNMIKVDEVELDTPIERVYLTKNSLLVLTQPQCEEAPCPKVLLAKPIASGELNPRFQFEPNFTPLPSPVGWLAGMGPEGKLLLLNLMDIRYLETSFELPEDFGETVLRVDEDSRQVVITVKGTVETRTSSYPALRVYSAPKSYSQ